MMFWKRSIRVSIDLKSTAFPIFWACRILGIAPLSVQKMKSNLMVELSPLQTVYSFTLGFITVYLAAKGVIDEVTDVGTYESTTEYIIVMNTIIRHLTIIIGIFGAPFRFVNLHNFIKFINEIDALMPQLNTKKARNASICAVIIVFLSAIISCSSMFYEMYFLFYKVDWLALFREALFYCIVMILECQYWYMTSVIQRRVHLFNKLLTFDNFTNGDEFRWGSIKLGEKIMFGATAICEEQNQHDMGMLDVNNDHSNGLSSRITFNGSNIATDRKESTLTDKFLKSENALKLTKVYINLCNAVDSLNDCCGLFISLIIVINLLYLTIIGYFLIVGVQNNFDVYFTALLSLTFLTHVYRLVFIVEPCENCLKEINQTNTLVCRLLCSDIGDSPKSQMKVLYGQLVQRKIEFSACGLGNIDRSIITTISANVAVYLVAAVQFKFSEH